MIGFLIVGEGKVNSHIRAKISNLVKNKKEEVVWTIQDHSFINLIYELNEPKNFNFGKTKNINQLITQKNISDEDVFTTTGTGSDLEKNNNMRKKNLFNQKSSKNLFHSANKQSIIDKDKNNNSFDLSKSFYSNNPKNNKSGLEFTITSEQNDSETKNNDNDSDDFLNINYQLLENNYIYNGTNNIYSKEYLTSLKNEDYEYDTFCQSIIISGLKPSKVNLLKNSIYLPSNCGHKECSQIFSFSPSILYSYQNKNKLDQIKISDLIAELIFPFGIKICFLFDSTHKYPKCEEPTMNIINNKKLNK